MGYEKGKKEQRTTLSTPKKIGKASHPCNNLMVGMSEVPEGSIAPIVSSPQREGTN